MAQLKRNTKRLDWLKILVWAVFLVSLLVTSAHTVVAQEIPAGFRLITQQPGVSLYQKDYPNGTPDYVQIIDLKQGASVDLLYGAPAAMNNQRNLGMFGGQNPSFQQKRIRSYWDEYASSHAGAFCVTNGQFFYMPESPTPLALPLRVDHQLLAEGFGFPQYPEKQLMLAIWPDHADILPLTDVNLAATTAESVLGGLTAEANKKPKNSVGRTFVGIWDKDSDLLNETIAIYTTRTATQAEAARTVRSFGASKVMMLDGGGSTQLICQGQTYIDTTRAIPQAIGVTAGSQDVSSSQIQALEAHPIVQPDRVVSPEAAASVDASFQEMPADKLEVALDQSDENAAQPAQSATTWEPELQVGAIVQTSAIVTASMSLPTAGSIESLLLPTSSSAEDSQLSRLSAGTLSAVPRPAASSNQANVLDVLWLPAIISPLSVFLILTARRQIFIFYQD